MEKVWKGNFFWLPKRKYPQLQETYQTVFCDKTGYHYTVALFRKIFSVQIPVKHMTLKVSASVKYRLYLNGKLLGRGPIIQGGDYNNCDVLDYWFYDIYTDISPLFLGENCLAAQVSLQTGIMSDYSLGRGGFAFEMTLELQDGTTVTYTSDETVACLPDKGAVSPKLQNGENSPPKSWKLAGFTDNDWDTAESQFMKELLERPIPLLDEQPVLAKEVKVPNQSFAARLTSSASLMQMNSVTKVAFGSPLTFVLDFGRIHAGRIHLECTGSPGTRVTMHISEIEGKIDSTVSFIMGKGAQEYQSWNLQSIRYLTVTISNISSSVEINNLYLVSSYYPVSQEGTFCCSDSLLNDIYQAGKNTLQFCRQDYHLDSPVHQEALGCTGDYMIESLMEYYTFGDPGLTRLDIWRTAQLLRAHDGVMFHTSYSLLYIQMISDYYLFTGDLECVVQTSDTVEQLLSRFDGYLGETGIIEYAPNYMFMDWVPVGKYNLHHPPKAMGQAYLTAMYYNALLQGEQLLRLCGKETQSSYWKQKAVQLKEAFHRNFWREERGLYCDGLPGNETSDDIWLPDNLSKTFFSQHTNTLAVLYGLAPKEYHQALMTQVISDDTLIQAQPYFMHFVLNALAESGLFEKYGLEQIRRWRALLEECPGSLKEVWYGFDCDYSHAWSGTPTYQLPARVLGVRPTKPGMTQIEIDPWLGDLTWAKGSVPTPYGMVKVSVEKQHDGIVLSLYVPNEIQWILPNKESFTCITVNDAIVSDSCVTCQ